MNKNRFVNQKLGKRTSRRINLLRAGFETVAKAKRAESLEPRSEKFFSPKRQPVKP